MIKKPREYYILLIPGELPEVWGHYPDLASLDGFLGEVVHVREIQEN